MSIISYSEMIKELDLCSYGKSDKTFSMAYIAANVDKRTGGDLIKIEDGQKCGLPYHCQDNEMRGVVDKATGKKSAFHLRLVLEFNGNTVYW